MQLSIPGFPGHIVSLSLIAPAMSGVPRINPAGQALTASGSGFTLTDGIILVAIMGAGYWAYTVFREEEQRAGRHHRERRPFGYQTHVPPAPRR